MLTEVKFAPGIDKQDTSVGAAGRWVDSDLARFRYGLPEKIGGWSSLLTDTIVGVARKQHSFVDKDGNRYVSIGTDKFLLIYFEGQLFDITPVKSTIASVVMSASDASKEVTLTFSSAHNLESGDIILLDSVTVPSGIGLTDAAFEDKLFQVTRVTSDLVAIITGTETTTGAAGGGSCSVIPYERVGPAAQSYGYGYGVSPYGGTVQGSATTTLNGGIVSGTTTITLTDSSSFPTSGTVLIGNFSSGSYASTSELVTYTGNTANQLTGCSRSQLGTTAPGSTSTGTTVTNATDWSGWGDAVDAGTIILEPGLWSLSNFSDTLVATIANGKTFTWNSAIAARLSTRASTTTSGFQTTNNPTATRITLISPTTRHLIHLGTETTIGDSTTQDDMFIRFSSAENINEYTPLATNSAGTQRIQDGTKIVGALVAKENILIWTNNALYTMKFVGAPFTFGFEQVGTNCGLIGKNAAVEIDGVAYWMSNNGFFAFDGTVNSLPCSVEDYVFDDVDTTKGQQVCAGLNNLFTEVVWYYPSAGSDYNDKYVVFNFGESALTRVPGGVWYTGTEARTSWVDATIYPKPFATKYSSTSTGTFPAIIGETGLGQTTLFEHEVGTDQVNPNGTTTSVTSFIKSYDIDLEQKGKTAISPALAGDAFLAMRRFVPDFKALQGNAKVSLGVKRYPQDTQVTTALSPFTITSSTLKKDTRARGRFVNIKIENDTASESWRFGTLRLDLQPDGRR